MISKIHQYTCQFFAKKTWIMVGILTPRSKTNQSKKWFVTKNRPKKSTHNSFFQIYAGYYRGIWTKKMSKSGRFYSVKWVLTFLADFSWRIIFSTGSFWTLVSKSKLKIWFFFAKKWTIYLCNLELSFVPKFDHYTIALNFTFFQIKNT